MGVQKWYQYSLLFFRPANIEMSRFLIIIIINLNKNIESIHF